MSFDHDRKGIGFDAYLRLPVPFSCSLHVLYVRAQGLHGITQWRSHEGEGWGLTPFLWQM